MSAQIPSKRPLLWLTLMVVAFFAIGLYSGIASYDNFHTHNASDVGIVTQAMASTTFHQQAPFYESYDCAMKDRCSFLLVHPGPVLYAAVPFYAAAPSSITLFALQALAVAIAAVPLFWLTRRLTRSDNFALLSAGLYLVGAPLFAETAFSLHLETLLPVELIGLAALWQAGRYRWGLLVALISFLSFEIAPVFVFLLGLFFLIPQGVDWWRRRKSAALTDGPASPPASSRLERWRSAIRDAVGRREVQYALLLMASALVATLALYSFMNVWGYWVLGVRPTVVAPGITGLFYNSSTTPIQSFGTILHSAQTKVTIEYWLILFGLVGFLPFLAPRTLVVIGPWVMYTFLTDNAKFSSIGLHTTLVVVGPLFIGVAYGLGRLATYWPQRAPAPTDGPVSAETADAGPRSFGRLARRRAVRTGAIVLLSAVVVANVMLLPINPLLPELGYNPGPPFISGYFNNPLTIQPGVAWTEELISHIPKNATIGADASIFPLLANYPYAVVMEGGIWPFGDPELSQLPFNLSSGPEYVLTAANTLRSQNAETLANISDPSRYGLSAYVTSTAIGPLLLFERGFTGRATSYGPPLPELRETVWPTHGIVAGPGGHLQTNSTAGYGTEIRSRHGVNNSVSVWTGPGVFLTPGSYSIVIEVTASGLGAGTPLSTPVLQVLESGYGPTLLNITVPRSAFFPGGWTNLTTNLTAPNPVPFFDLEGFVLDAKAVVAVASETIEPE